MFKDDKPLAAANDTAKVKVVDASQGEWATAQNEDDLFEDILDIEGPVRSAMIAVAGFSSPGVDDLERGIAVLDGRIPEETSALLRTQADTIRKTAAAGDAAGMRVAQGAVVDLLVALRETQ